MAAALQCEICGGRLIGKPGGLFECDSCGMEYSTEWARAKIQEVRGTVKVEGTVEVKGTVKVEGPVKVEGGVNIESLLKRGQLALEDGKWKDAAKFFDNALNLDAQRADAHWGMLCVKYEQPDISGLLKEKYEKIRTDRDYQRALDLSDNKIKGWASSRELKFQTDQAEAKAMAEKKAMELESVRKRARAARQLILSIGELIFGVKSDGTVCVHGTPNRFQTELVAEVRGWRDICAIGPAPGWKSVVGLKYDGSVVMATESYSGDKKHKEEVAGWTDIAAIYHSWNNVIGLRKDGTVVMSGHNYYHFHDGPALSEWQNIVDIHADKHHIYGVQADGRVVFVSSEYEENNKIGTWRNIVAVGGYTGLFGLKRDGTIAAQYRDDAKDWTDVVALSFDGASLCGLRADGTVLSQFGSHDEMQNVAAVSRRIALKTDGTIVRLSGCDPVPSWKLFDDINTLVQEREATFQRKGEEKQTRDAQNYQRACELLKNSWFFQDIKTAQMLFAELKDYRDAKEQLPKCEEETKRWEKYNAAIEDFGNDSKFKVQAARDEFLKLGDWKDSREMAEKCKGKIKRLKQQDDLHSQKWELQRERSGLGLFAGKRKKEIDAQLRQIEDELERLQAEHP